MFVLDFLRYVKGYVYFSASGGFVERFLNLVARDRIPVWNGRKTGDTYKGCTYAGSYKKMRKHAKKTGVRLNVEEKRGVPFTRHKYRRRTGVLAGLAIFAAFIYIMSCFIWRIEVHGNGDIPESKVLQVLEGMGIAPGTLRAGIDVRASERKALLLLHEFSWVALNIEGSTIYVEVNRSVEPPLVLDPKKPCNIIASASGQIISLDAYEGQPLKKVGDAVLEGEIIISGITQDRLGQNLFRHAQAKVIARVNHRIEVAIPLEQSKYVDTGKTKSRTFIGIMGLDIPLFIPLKIPHPYTVERKESPLMIFSLQLPVSLKTEKYTLMDEVPVTLTPDEAKAQALSALSAAQNAQLGDAEIFEKNLTAATKDGVYILRADYICDLDIAREKEIFIGDSAE